MPNGTQIPDPSKAWKISCIYQRHNIGSAYFELFKIQWGSFNLFLGTGTTLTCYNHYLQLVTKPSCLQEKHKKWGSFNLFLGTGTTLTCYNHYLQLVTKLSCLQEKHKKWGSFNLFLGTGTTLTCYNHYLQLVTKPSCLQEKLKKGGSFNLFLGTGTTLTCYNHYLQLVTKPSCLQKKHKKWGSFNLFLGTGTTLTCYNHYLQLVTKPPPVCKKNSKNEVASTCFWVLVPLWHVAITISSWCPNPPLSARKTQKMKAWPICFISRLKPKLEPYLDQADIGPSTCINWTVHCLIFNIFILTWSYKNCVWQCIGENLYKNRNFPSTDLGPNNGPFQIKKWAKTSQNGEYHSRFLSSSFKWKFHENLIKNSKVTDAWKIA